MMTERQNAVMNWIAFNEMTPCNGARPESVDDTHVYLWIDEISNDCGFTVNETKGVIGSLVEAGLAYTNPESNPDDSGLGMTEQGFAAWAAQNPA